MKNIALAISSQMINYNIPFFRGHIKLSGQVLSSIYQGKITVWNDPAITGVEPDLPIPADKIVVLHRSDSSGDTFIFSSYLSAADPNGWGANIGYGTSISFPSISNSLGESGNAGMLTGCQATPGCIAYIGISYESKVGGGRAGPGRAPRTPRANYELPTPATVLAESQALDGQDAAERDAVDDLRLRPRRLSHRQLRVRHHPAQGKQHPGGPGRPGFPYWAVDPNKGSNSSFLDQVNFQPLPPAIGRLPRNGVAQIAG